MQQYLQEYEDWCFVCLLSFCYYWSIIILMAYLVYRKCRKAMGKTLTSQSNMHHHTLFMTSLTKEQQTTIAHVLEMAFSKKQDRLIFKKVANILINR